MFAVARDSEGNLGLFIGFKPVRITMKFPNGEDSLGGWTAPEGIDDYEVIELPPEMFPDLKWEDDPLEIDLVGKGKKNYNERYKKLVESESFKEIYSNKSLGRDELEEEPIDLIAELKEYLSNTSEDQKKKDWEEIKSLFPGDETIKKHIDYPDCWEGIDPELKTLWENENFSTETGDHQMYVDERLLMWIARKSMEYQKEQMIKDAQDAVVHIGSDGILYAVPIMVRLDEEVPERKKVKLIIIK